MMNTVAASLSSGVRVPLGLQRSVDARVGDVLAVVEALGVDAEQDFDAVPGPLGDIGSGDSGVEPEGHCRVAHR